jgi:hypothetical protein
VAPADELCGCGERFSTCPVWVEVGAAAFGGWSTDVLDRLAGLRRAAARQRNLPRLLGRGHRPSGALGELREAYGRIYRAVAEVTDSVVVVDASKGPALGQALSGSPDIDLRMLNVVRDPRAVAWSWTREVQRPHATAGSSEMWRIPVHRAAAQWSALQAEMEVIARLGGAPFARLRYEDFVVDPVGALVEATAVLEVPLSPADLPEADGSRVVLGPSHGLSGNPSRFRSGSVELRRDDGWRLAMPSVDRAVVSAIALPLLLAYGYSRDGLRSGVGAPRTRERSTS